MDIMNILKATLSLSAMGIIFGLILGYSSKVFAVKVDEKIPAIADCLPGANCGACGFAGCEAYAKSIVGEGSGITLCSVGGAATAAKIAEIMGVSAEDVKSFVATVRCCGANSDTEKKYKYIGIESCDAAMRLAGGEKTCKNSCIGLGTCVKRCAFGAIEISDGVAYINPEKCTSCGLCIESCPKSLITLVPKENRYYVGCSNMDKGGVTRKICEVGCIGCKICEKACEYDAIHVTENFSKIDYEKCVSCGECAEKCPRKIIRIREI